MNTTSISNPSLLINRGLTLKLRFNLKAFWVIIFISILALLAFYIFQVNAMISQTYQIKDYQKKLEEIIKENETLKINSVKINSLETLENKILEFGFEKVDKIHYIQVSDTQIATK
ncbi:hypothetical protein KJA15_02350 [Patescibacteria group bacterium]|nr:hypothetical protein [Patescibacteria group bacterium]